MTNNLFTLDLPPLVPTDEPDCLLAAAQATLMGLPLEIEFYSGTHEHQAEIHWVSPCCHHRGSITWATCVLGFAVPCVTCGRATVNRFADYASTWISVGSLWEEGVPVTPLYSEDLVYRDHAIEWLTDLLETEGKNTLAVEVAPMNLVDDIVRRLQELPIPASTQDASAWQ